MQFANLMVEDMQKLDILASWRPEEIFFRKYIKSKFRIDLSVLDPRFDKNHWMRSLAGKRVLVVHPFAETILKQYENNRGKIWGEYADSILPKFSSLEVVKAVQTIAGNRSEFNTWFDALEHMKREIDKHDFDVALIGCGAYGFPLAAYVKRIGKQAIHIGGPLQLYFGIKGKRWDDKDYYNEYWISPADCDKPKNMKLVENGCYW